MGVTMADQAQGWTGRVTGWPAGVKGYIQELQTEMRRVTWPSWKQVRGTTGVVIACVFAFAAYFYVVDLAVGRVINRILNLFTR